MENPFWMDWVEMTPLPQGWACEPAWPFSKRWVPLENVGSLWWLAVGGSHVSSPL